MQEAEQTLANKEIRPTAMRLLLLEHLMQHPARPFSLSELETAFPKSDRITIYRSLKTFAEKGLVHEIEQAGGGNKFALCEEDCSPAGHQDQHPHFHCTVCDQLQCLEDNYIPVIALPAGYQVQETMMTIRGVCADCADQNTQ